VRNNTTALAATLLRTGEADALICGTIGRYASHLKQIEIVVGMADGVGRLAAMNGLVLKTGTLFIADTHVQVDPDAEDLAEITALCADEVRRFGQEPRSRSCHTPTSAAMTTRPPARFGGPAADPARTARSGRGRRDARRSGPVRGTAR